MSVAIFFPSEDYTLAWIGEVTGCLTLDLELVLSKIIAYPPGCEMKKRAGCSFCRCFQYFWTYVLPWDAFRGLHSCSVLLSTLFYLAMATTLSNASFPEFWILGFFEFWGLPSILFPWDFKSVFVWHLTGKILSFEFYPKAVFLDFIVRLCSGSKLTYWTSESWIEDKMTSKTHQLKITAYKLSLLYMQSTSWKVLKFEAPVLHINLVAY